jgi:O-succinylbenzoate synthase
LVRDQISINATLPAVTPDEVADVLSQFGKFKTVKIKVAGPGESLAQDMARIERVRALYPEAKLRLDANGGYSVSQALQMVEQLTQFNLEYLEQPVHSVAEMAELRKQLAGTGVKIAADESIRKTGDPQAVMRAEAADIVMLKAQPLGGIAASLEIANSLGLEVVVSSALETSLGISQGLHLAGALPELNYDCGLGTLNLFDGDIVEPSLIPNQSMLDVGVVEPDLELLEKYAASPERTSWWEARLERCLDLNT